MIWEARYRPSEKGNLRLYEFAVETDKDRYRSPGKLEDELRDYESCLKAIVAVIKYQKKKGEQERAASTKESEK